MARVDLSQVTLEQPRSFREEVEGELEFLGSTLKKGAIPTALAVGTFALTKSPTATAIAAGTGETINQALGITEPSAGQIAIEAGSAFIPFLGKMVGATGRFIGRHTPGTQAARHSSALTDLGKIPATVRPVEELSMIYRSLRLFKNLRFDMPNVRNAAATLLKTESLVVEKLKNSQLIALATELRDWGRPFKSFKSVTRANPRGGATTTQIPNIEGGKGSPIIPFEQIHETMKRLGSAIKSATDDTTRGAYKLLQKALRFDLENAAKKGTVGLPAVQALKKANASAKASFAADDMELMVKAAIVERKTATGTTIQINATKLINDIERKLRSSKNFGDVWRPHWTQLKKDIQEIAKIPDIPPPPSVAVGSSLALGRGSAAGAAASFFGFETTGVLVAGAAGIAIPRLLTRMFMSPTGMKVAKAWIKERGPFMSESFRQMMVGLLVATGAIGAEEVQRSALRGMPAITLNPRQAQQQGQRVLR